MPVNKTVNVAISTDKGMCGGINTQTAKLVNFCTAVDEAGMVPQIIVFELQKLYVCKTG